jgi:5-methyltetrahydropteroyltriglutamate--homocysteine methyltransferase
MLITHVGSLPRPQPVADLLVAQDDGLPIDPVEFESVIAAAVAAQVERQIACGVDLVSDGEMSKISYATYVRHRLSGFELGDVPRAMPADLDAFPRFRDRQTAAGIGPRYKRPICRGPIFYEGSELLARDVNNLRAALKGRRVEGAFMNAPSPGVIAVFLPNEYYESREDYFAAIGAAMRVEYKAIVEAGFQLQIDAPDLAMGRHIMYRTESDDGFVSAVALHVDVLNEALNQIPPERVRLHICWGNYEGPHHCDIPVEKIMAQILRVKGTAIVFEAANPRHAHEWPIWRNARIADDRILVPGVIDTSTNYIEHPLLVAERLNHFIDIVGIERVIAGTDCGFGTWAGFGRIDPDICWAKLQALADGAELAASGRRVGR